MYARARTTAPAPGYYLPKVLYIRTGQTVLSIAEALSSVFRITAAQAHSSIASHRPT